MNPTATHAVLVVHETPWRPTKVDVPLGLTPVATVQLEPESV